MKFLSFSCTTLLLFSLIGCQQNQENTDNKSENEKLTSSKIDTVEIISKLKKGEVSYLYYFDHFQDITMPIEFKDSMKLKIAFKDLLLLRDTEKQITFPVSSSEKLFISKNGNQSTILTSKNEQRNKELAILIPVIEKNQPFFYKTDFRYEKILSEIDNLNSKNEVSPNYVESIKKLVFFHYITNVIPPLFRELPKIPKTELDNIYKEKNLLNNESYMINSDFRWALIAYSKFIIGKSFNTSKEFKALMDSVDSNFKGKTKDFLIFYHLNKVRKQDKTFQDYLQAYLKNSTSDEFKNYLTEKYLTTPKILKGELISEKDESEDYQALLNKYKGKVIYIDFWASWCMPCRAEIPASKKLIESYKDKSIQFMTISMDENKVAWRKAMRAEDLKETQNYQLVANFESSLAKQFKIQSIPRYVIIGKDGKIINQDAPRPSDPKIRKVFDELLKK